MKLYELVQDFIELENLSEQEVDEQQLHLIREAVIEEMRSKSGNIIKVVKNMESDIKAIDDEIKRLNSLKKTRKNTLDNLKNYTKNCLIDMNQTKIQTPFGNISIRNNQASLNIIDETLIPDAYMIEEVIHKSDNKALKDDLKEGKQIPGCELTYSKSIIIK